MTGRWESALSAKIDSHATGGEFGHKLASAIGIPQNYPSTFVRLSKSTDYAYDW